MQPTERDDQILTRRLIDAGKSALLGLPALVLRVPSAFADEIEQAGESARQALTQVLPHAHQRRPDHRGML